MGMTAFKNYLKPKSNEQQSQKQEFLEAVKDAIKFSGQPASEFARRLNLHRSVFSTKLNERNASFTAPELRALLLALVELQGINRRDELLYLLRLAGLREATFSQVDWNTRPLNELD